MGNAQLFLNGGSCAGIIARQHRHLNAHILQFAHSLYAGFFQGIRHGQRRQTCRFSQTAAAFCRLPTRRLWSAATLGNSTPASASRAALPARQALPASLACTPCQTPPQSPLPARAARPFLFGMGQHGPGQRMFAGLFQAGRQMQQSRFIKPLRRQKVCHHRLTVCKGAGFIQHHGVHRMGCFQRLARFDKNAVFRRPCQCPP